MKKNTNFFIIGTPIGNLGDISLRAIECLKKSDIIFAEDTRTALNLLNHLEIKKKVLSCHKDNEKKIIDKILQELSNNNIVSLISEAGMPCISDPGSEVVKELIKENISFEVVSGPTALINALILSGFSGGSFYFHGFLPHKSSEKLHIIKNLTKILSPIIIYESPHRLKDTLKLLLEVFTPPIVCVRELTKIYEERIEINNISDIENIVLKGEFVIIINNSFIEKDTSTNNNLDINNITKQLKRENFSSHDMIKILKILGVKRNDAYKIIMNNQ